MAAPPFGISMLGVGRAAPAPRFWPAAKTLVHRKSGAAQKGRGPASPFGISMLGAAEPPLHRGFALQRKRSHTAQRHRRPEGRLSGSSLLFQDFKILILTTFSTKKDICEADVLFCGLCRPQGGSTLRDSNAIPPAPRPSDIEQHQGGLPFKSRKQGERDAECKAAFLKDWYNNSKREAKGGDGFGAFDFMVGWTRG